KSLNQALKNPKESSLSAELTDINLVLGEIQKLFPEYASNPYFKALATKSITGNLFAQGNLQKIDNFKTNINWGAETLISANGELTNFTKIDSLTYGINELQFKSTRNDIQRFISSKDLGISIPQKLNVTSTLSGSMKNIRTNTVVRIPEGTAKLDGFLKFDERLKFDALVQIDSLNLGNLLKNNQFGTISFQAKGDGSGTELKNMDAKVTCTVSRFDLNHYSYKAIQLDGNLLNGTGSFAAEIKDPNLNAIVNTTIDLSSDTNNVILSSTLSGADLKRLGFTKNDIKIAADISATYSGTPSNYEIKATIEKAVAVTDNEQYQVEPIALRAHIEDSVTDVSVNSGFLNGELYSNASPIRINKALKQQLEHYFSTVGDTQVNDSVMAKLKFSIKPTPILDKVFFNGFTDLDSLNIDADFDSKKQLLYGEVKIPKISYAGSSIDSLNILLNGDAKDLRFSAGLGNLTYEPIHLKQTYLEGNLQNKRLVLDFNAKNDSVQVMHINSELVFQKDTLRLHINPKELILNKKQWEIPEENSIVLAESFLALENLELTRNQQKLQVATQVPKMKEDHIGILFENFELQTFLSLFNPDEALAKGQVQGDFILLNPYGATGLVSDIQIDNFRLMQNPLGTLTLDASSQSLSSYDFDLALKEGDAKLRLSGDYVAKETDAELRMELDIQEVKTSVIQGFFKEEISNSKGYLSGSMLVGGTLRKPDYSGIINFTDTGLTLKQFNTVLSVDKETVNIDQEKITFSNFDITDNTKGTLSINGAIMTPTLTNPSFDFSVKADRFRVLDSKKGDNELVYGIASINADLKVEGDLNLPIINGKLKIRDITDLTYVVPQEQLDIQERDGVVIFVNKENAEAILTRNEGQSSNSVFAGMDINTTLEISNEAVFKVILDEKTQDMLQASGEATLSLNIDPNKDIRLSGRLELNSGLYRTSLYNLVSREFQIKKGSNIVWAGDPYDAKLDVTATYEIETSASPLMSSVSGGQDSGVTGTYRQAADFLVYLNVEGQLTEPKLSFALDMPEKEQGSFGGAVYGRIQQLNRQESELNKQVFSLLALNRFYPTTGSDGSSGGALNLARNNVNKVLSSELNAISDKLLGKSGFELGFDLDSFEDYESGTAQSRTQLNINASKKLFNDRLIVTAGSALDVEGSATSEDSATPLIGNVTLEYLLSEEGIYRLKGFRRQEYQNIVDGQLIITGIAFIFNREFNKFSQLFRPKKSTLDEETKKEK
ncbi:MAG: translocation/assembly module TamB domain-containing protein, partial [Maribacter sp.]